MYVLLGAHRCDGLIVAKVGFTLPKAGVQRSRRSNCFSRQRVVHSTGLRKHPIHRDLCKWRHSPCKLLSMPNYNKELSGPFTCYAPSGFEDQKRRILYIGKATGGEFDGDDACERSFNGTTAFWDFARSISRLADPNCTDLQNLAWSNIFKQGVLRGNPTGKIAETQRASAIQSLQEEVNQLQPHLIVLVNAGYYEEIPKAAYLIDDGEVGEKALTRTTVEGEEKYDLWSRATRSASTRLTPTLPFA